LAFPKQAPPPWLHDKAVKLYQTSIRTSEPCQTNIMFSLGGSDLGKFVAEKARAVVPGALRGDAFAALRSMPEYGRLSAKDQKAVRDLIGEELNRFKATASSVSRGRFRREKRARVPDWTPAELAKAALEARP
jgi:hypothetical protein